MRFLTTRCLYGLNSNVDLDSIAKLLKTLRASDVAHFKMGDIEVTLQPSLPQLNMASDEDLGLPADPGDPALEHTSPYIPPNTKTMKHKRSKVKLSADGEVIHDPSNPLNPENPVSFGDDFPEMPAVPGYTSFR